MENKLKEKIFNEEFVSKNREYVKEIENFVPKVTFKRILRTINKNVTHINLVRYYCFKSGLIYQGLVHDMSKWTPTEFFGTAKYFSHDYASPVLTEVYITGKSNISEHHLKRNKHHVEYWYNEETGEVKEIPYKYIVEMICDMVAASKGYHKNVEWNMQKQINFWEKYLKPKKKHMFHKLAYNMIERVFYEMIEAEDREILLNKKYFQKVYKEEKEKLEKDLT